MGKHDKRQQIQRGIEGHSASDAIVDLLLLVKEARELVKQVLTLNDCGELGSGKLAQMKATANRFKDADLYPEYYTEYK